MCLTKFPEIFAALAAPFEDREVKQRAQGGKQISYVTARTVMNRLDDVLGPENWWDSYSASEHSVLCRLTIRLPSGEEPTKEDAGGYAGMSDQGDDDKSGHSDALKRAAVKWGVGRYLYRDGVPRFALAAHGPAQDAPPRNGTAPRRAEYAEPPRGRQEGNGGVSLPQTGKALFAWLADMKEKTGNDEVKRAAEYGERKGWADRMVQWTPEQVAEVVEKYRGVEVAS